MSPIAISPIGIASEHTFLAYIDGKDQLIVQGSTVQWHHLEWELPGGSGRGRTSRPTWTACPGGPPGGDAREYRVSFPYQDTPGEYTVAVGPEVQNLAGQEMN